MFFPDKNRTYFDNMRKKSEQMKSLVFSSKQYPLIKLFLSSKRGSPPLLVSHWTFYKNYPASTNTQHKNFWQSGWSATIYHVLESCSSQFDQISANQGWLFVSKMVKVSFKIRSKPPPLVRTESMTDNESVTTNFLLSFQTQLMIHLDFNTTQSHNK